MPYVKIAEIKILSSDECVEIGTVTDPRLWPDAYRVLLTRKPIDAATADYEGTAVGLSVDEADAIASGLSEAAARAREAMKKT